MGVPGQTPGPGRGSHDRASFNDGLCAVCGLKPVHLKARCRSCYEALRRQRRIWDADLGEGKMPMCTYCQTFLDGSYIMVRVMKGGVPDATLAFHNTKCLIRYAGKDLSHLKARQYTLGDYVDLMQFDGKAGDVVAPGLEESG